MNKLWSDATLYDNDEKVDLESLLIDDEDEVVDLESSLIDSEDGVIRFEFSLKDSEDQVVDLESSLIDSEDEALKLDDCLIDSKDEVINLEDSLIDDEDISINKNEIYLLLYKALSTSFLKNMSIDICTTTPNKMRQLVEAFNLYAIAHTTDCNSCDREFEKTAKLFFLPSKTDSLQDNFIPTVLPKLIDWYKKDVDVNLYAKIYLLNKIAVKYHLPNYIDSLKVKSPFED